MQNTWKKAPERTKKWAHIHPRIMALLVMGLLGLISPAMAQKQSTYAHGIVMVHIPAGSFMMGSNYCPPQSEKDKFLGNEASCQGGDPDAYSEEAPRHTVSVGAFQLGKTEVTLGQFKAYIKAAGRTSLVDDDFIKYNVYGDDAPVVKVSWNDAQGFVQWLNQSQGGGWRLPSEAEWEYACRAGGQHKYCGSNNVSEVAWFAGNSGNRQRTVASKKPNAWGLHDMSGNVEEWVQDCWHDSYAGAPTDGSAWNTGCKDNNDRVVRGGTWGDGGARLSRAAKRFYYSPGGRYLYYFGFRLARTAP